MDKGLDLWEAIVERTLCDLEKAFDCIKPHILLSKLSYGRITGKSHAWIKSCFGNRYKRLVINFNHNTFSDQGVTKHGVTQRSILGPLLFLLCK